MDLNGEVEMTEAANVRLSIGGTETDAAEGRTFARIDPITGEIATNAAAASVADAQAAADAAAAAFPAWSATGPNARRALLNKAAGALEARGNDFVAAMMSETGSTEGWARFNLMLAAGMVRE